MPELPEVEAIKNSVAPILQNQRVERVIVRTPKMRYPIPKNLKACLEGATFKEFGRRAKYLTIAFSPAKTSVATHRTKPHPKTQTRNSTEPHTKLHPRTHTEESTKPHTEETTSQLLVLHMGPSLVFHMGMSGRLRITKPNSPHLSHDHLVLLTRSHKLAFYDPRRFGFVRWQSQLTNVFNKLGIEATAITPKKLESITANHSATIKNVLLNQRLIAGLGNIYALEALFAAAISPFAPASSLGVAELKRLSRAIKTTLARAISDGGSTIRDHIQPTSDGVGVAGYFQTRFRVYGRKNMPCFRCKTPIIRVVQNQRASFYCSQCQK